jgi:protein phosphatase
MLICPQCKFENPNSNKFCQSCGASLIHQVCAECDAEVPINEQFCHNCGADCGRVWQAIILQSGTGNDKLDTGEDTEESSDAMYLENLGAGSFLDQEQRYQLLDKVSGLENNLAPSAYVKVLDCQPYQISPLEAILAHQQDDLMLPSVGIAKFSPLVQAYLDLQSDPAFPSIHDAWEANDLQVLLIADRSQWECLLDLWEAETTSTIQILHYLYQMTLLWSKLARVNCCRSLLDLQNLRLDEDQTLALQQLYLDSWFPESETVEADLNISEQPLSIKCLGEVWQGLFRQSQRTQFGAIMHIFADLEQGKIETVDQLRSRLEAIAGELETPIPSNSDAMAKKEIAAPTILQSDDVAEVGDDLPTVLLSMQLHSLDDAGCTDIGSQRNYNEDYFGIQTKINKLNFPHKRVLAARGLYIVCDGMGGHAGGEVASKLAVNTLQEYFDERWLQDEMPTEDMLREAVYLANKAIYDVNQQEARAGIKRMGTTLVMLLIQGTEVAVAHVGDSRLYRVTRKRGLEQITVDHEVGQREIARGVEPSVAYARPDAYQLTQALGPRDRHSINPDVEFFEISEDSLFILVSDGLSDNDVLETYGQNLLFPLLRTGANLEQGVMDLMDLANEYNGHDNITAILVRAKVRPNMDG